VLPERRSPPVWRSNGACISAVMIEALCSTEMFSNTESYSRTSYIPERFVILEAYSVKLYIPERDVFRKEFYSREIVIPGDISGIIFQRDSCSKRRCFRKSRISECHILERDIPDGVLFKELCYRKCYISERFILEGDLFEETCRESYFRKIHIS
jgi:hypothetical protein